MVAVQANGGAMAVFALTSWSYWGDRRGLNPQPPVPQTMALFQFWRNHADSIRALVQSGATTPNDLNSLNRNLYWGTMVLHDDPTCATRNGPETMLVTSPGPDHPERMRFDMDNSRYKPMTQKAKRDAYRLTINTPHEQRIRALMAADPTLQRYGMGGKVMKFARQNDYDIDPPRFVPDLYFFDPDNLVLHMYEVESTARLTKGKLNDIARFAMHLDSEDADWQVKLFVVDIHDTPPREIDWGMVYIRGCHAHVEGMTA